MAKLNLVGLVVSQGKMAKTVKVRVQGKVYDKRIHKEVIKRKDYLVHDEGNLCKEGDIVRIEAIPRISARKTFAIAEIKVNKGQQFALYETIAQERLQQQEQQLTDLSIKSRQEVENTITKIEDLKILDKLVNRYQREPDAEEQNKLVSEVNRIKEKYGIKSWPSTEPIVELELNAADREISEIERRTANFGAIYEKYMTKEWEEERNRILSLMTKTPVDQLAKNTAKNILRKYVLDVRNECPV
ncbi:nucleic acid-binding protein [Suhomyces tanzawaensis NRRL Y-17324]|uniref:Nucleic acid-binding protein n=1 Tax=Suhomyces tanzawaensis NRRL Y-17324 TaxID=984487 RepID=A0A1E4SEA9_9ASCO|nr:nucleic acid-binding protein [Suhomyces tanzawaensis NRRL Y-17324]ODV77732.1 nucleic acid-binding protein [Suhomyces tanzawaensis NRRL Y-17324]